MRDYHHVLFNAKEWSLRPESKELRDTGQLIPLMERDVHNALHKQCSPVPLLGYDALKLVLRDYVPIDGSVMGSVGALLKSINEAGKKPRISRMQTKLALLVIETIEEQQPFIREGMPASEQGGLRRRFFT